MFGIWKRKEPEVHQHWFAVLPEFETSTADFYAAIENHLEVRRVPGLATERIDHAEGGLLSAKREYLRMRRERLVFDVCSAPFGTFWFFSCRFSEIPCVLYLWEIIVLLLFLTGIEFFYANLFGWMLGSIFLGTTLLGMLLCLSGCVTISPQEPLSRAFSCGFPLNRGLKNCLRSCFVTQPDKHRMLLLMRNLVRVGLHDLDAALIRAPIIGAFYELFLRKETYYRTDTRLAYIEIVDKIVRAHVDEIAVAKGVQLVEYKDATPPSHPRVMQMIGDLLRLSR